MDGKKFSIVVAVDAKNGIGINGQLPWTLPEDMKHFRRLTCGEPWDTNAVIMGRKTWESIPLKFRPLPKRNNVVITRNKTYEVPDGVCVAGSLGESLSVNAKKIFVIGGAEIYAEAIKHKDCEGLYITRIQNEYECDTFLSAYEDLYKQSEVLASLDEGGVGYSIEHWLRQ